MTPEQCEQASKQQARIASKEAADEKHEAEQAEIKADMVRAALTADDVVKLLEGHLPEITALTAVDVVSAWVAKLEAKQVLAEQNRRADAAKKLKVDASNKKNNDKNASRGRANTAQHTVNKAQGQKEIDNRKTA